MIRSLAVALALSCGLMPMAGVAAQASVTWGATGNDRQHYRVDGSGDPAGEQGATVAVRAQHPDPGKFGGSITFLDAAPYRGRTIELSADLDTHEAVQGAALWLRADGGNGKPIAFASSQGSPVRGTASGVHREIQLTVPTATTHFVMGTTLMGDGEVVARHLRLVVRASATRNVPPSTVLDAAIHIVRTHALRRRDVDWHRLEPELRAMAKDAKVPVDVYSAIRVLLARLDDHHSFLMEPFAVHRDQTGGGPSSPATVALKTGGVGYIDMPGYTGMQTQARRAFVADVIGSIGRIAGQARCGWVVDLRRDIGGSMLPMLASLRPLLGDQTLGSFRDADGKQSTFSAASALDKVVPQGPALDHAAVAVLLGPHTASSGEVVAVAFRGRPNTRSFGQPTAGLSTGNTGFSLPDGSRIFLTTSVDVDRTGRAYGGKLQPDQPVVAATTPGSDPTLDAAQAWLASSCAH
jgi:hypothetical protein